MLNPGSIPLRPTVFHFDIILCEFVCSSLNCHLFSVDQPEMTVPLVDHMNPTCRMKTIAVDGKPQLCLFAPNNEEITYNHGDPEWPSDARYGNFTLTIFNLLDYFKG